MFRMMRIFIRGTKKMQSSCRRRTAFLLSHSFLFQFFYSVCPQCGFLAAQSHATVV